MKKLKEPIGTVKKGLKKDARANLDVATIQARWDAACQFVQNMLDNVEFDVVDAYTQRDLHRITKMCNRQQLSSTEYSVNRKGYYDDRNVKLIFNKEHTLCEMDSQINFFTWRTHENLQAKFFYDDANELTKVSYRNKCVYYNQNNCVINKTDTGVKLIDLTQKQIDQETATAMTK